jgi:hypothetical protein
VKGPPDVMETEPMPEFRTLRARVFLPPFHPNDEDPLLCMERISS